MWLGFHQHHMFALNDTFSDAPVQYIQRHERKISHEKVQKEDGGKGLEL